MFDTIAIDLTTQSPALPLYPAAALPPSLIFNSKLLRENNLLKKFKIWFCDLGFPPYTELHIHAILQQIYHSDY